MEEQILKKAFEVSEHFKFEGKVTELVPYGHGHINDTYRVTAQIGDADSEISRCYILQRMNDDIFTSPEELMENVIRVTEHLKKKIRESGGDEKRETLNLIETDEGKFYYVDDEGDYWRGYLFIEGASTYDSVENREDFYQSAVAFGHFQRMLADFPAAKLHETIPDFHNTPKRYRTFMEVLQADRLNRAADAKDAVDFAIHHEKLSHALADMQKKGELPLRVTHNDTKLNNIMIDDVTRKAICVIDLDTVMPGLAANDFGDSIRFGANTGAEDEVDLSKVSLDLSLFELYAKGYTEGLLGSLTKREIETLPLGAMLMTYECGLRFLTDYIDGDHYFKIHREGHNLDRARAQFALLADMERKYDKMQDIVK